MTHVQRIGLYERTIVIEWMMLAFAVAGVWLYKSPLSALLEPRWSSLRSVLADLGIGFGFLIVTLAVVSFFGHGRNDATMRILPTGSAELGF